MSAGSAVERRAWRAPRDVLAVVALLAVALPILVHEGRHQSFYLDEFYILFDRSPSDPASLVTPWFGHWVTLPTLAYGLVYEGWRLRSYLPYQLLGLAGHYLVVVMAWLMARRLGARPWIAVAAVVPLVVLGSGRPNILFGFQVTLTAALGLGVAHLLLATHVGPWSRRDLAGLACGLAALMCSGVAVATAVGVGVAVLCTRGWRAAAGHVVPLATAYLTWRAFAPSSPESQGSREVVSVDAARFAYRMTLNAVYGLGGSRLAAVCLLVIACVGCAGVARIRPADRPTLGALIGSIAAAATFVVITAVTRVGLLGLEGALEQRYVHILVALLIPVVGAGAEVLCRRSIWLAVPALLPMAVGMPGNFAALDQGVPDNELAAFVLSDRLTDADPDDVLHPILPIPIRDLQEAATTNRDEWERADVAPAEQLAADVMVSLAARNVAVPGPCTLLPSRTIRAVPGEPIRIAGIVAVTGYDGDLTADLGLPYTGEVANALVPSSDITVTIRGLNPDSGVLDC